MIQSVYVYHELVSTLRHVYAKLEKLPNHSFREIWQLTVHGGHT